MMLESSNLKRSLLLSLLCGLIILLLAACTQASPEEEKVTVLNINAADVSEQITETETIPLNNCQGNQTLKLDVEREREFQSTVQFGAGGRIGPRYPILANALLERYSISGEKEKQTYSLHLSAQPKSYIIYTLAWEKITFKGYAILYVGGDVIKDGDVIEYTGDGEMKEVPFEAVTRITLEIIDSEQVDCG